MITKEELYPIGKFQRTHALKGELNMLSEIDPEYFMEGNPMIIEDEKIFVPYYVETVRKKGSTTFLVKLDGVDTESQASVFVNKDIYILKQDAEEIIGEDIDILDSSLDYEVIDNESGIKLGKIEFLDDSTENELFIIRNEEGEEIMIPANEDFIVEVDDEAKIIKMSLPEGLIDINSKK